MYFRKTGETEKQCVKEKTKTRLTTSIRIKRMSSCQVLLIKGRLLTDQQQV